MELSGNAGTTGDLVGLGCMYLHSFSFETEALDMALLGLALAVLNKGGVLGGV